MDLSIYDIILGPVVTEKAYSLNRDLKRLVLRVHPQANKPLVKKAIKQLFNAEVDAVNIMNRSGKIRRVGRRVVQGPSKKIAIVTLAEGYSLNLFDQSGENVATNQRIATEEKV
jgi:large subunit ribosomal protein L23